MLRKLTSKHGWLNFTALAVGGALGFSTAGAHAQVVAPDRLVNADAEPQNWMTVYGNYSSQMHSSLDRINRDNVADLRLVFAHSLGPVDRATRHQNTPLVVDGFLYVANGEQEVFKFDVSSGNRAELVWRYNPEVEPIGLFANRGQAVLGENVYINTTDGRLIALNAASGEVVFDESFIDTTQDNPAQWATGAPLAVGDKIMIGQSNGYMGNRGALFAHSAEDGSNVWRFWSVPGPGEFGHETWADDHDAWRTGGGAVWTTPSYDPETELVIYGTGDPAPWGDPEFRPGDNLFTVSTVALDVNTGELAWYFQETPNESWDFDSINPKLLYAIEIDGEMRNVSGNFARNGFYYNLDRASGEFLSANQYAAEVNWTAGIDPKTGLPVEYDPNVLLQEYAGNAMRYARGETGLVCPWYSGSGIHFPSTYDPSRQVAYNSGLQGCGELVLDEPTDPDADWRGVSIGGGWERVFQEAAGVGHITAVDVITGEIVEKRNTRYPLYAGLLSTGGDLIFTGTLNGEFVAYDADTLEELFSMNFGTPIAAPPISYSVDGNQYIAVVAGGQHNGSGSRNPELDELPLNAMLLVFGL